MKRIRDLDRSPGSIMDAPAYGWQPAGVMWGHVTDIIAKPHDWFFFSADNQPCHEHCQVY